MPMQFWHRKVVFLAYIYFFGLGFVIRIGVWVHCTLTKTPQKSSPKSTRIYLFSVRNFQNGLVEYDASYRNEKRYTDSQMGKRMSPENWRREKKTKIWLRRVAVTCCSAKSERKENFVSKNNQQKCVAIELNTCATRDRNVMWHNPGTHIRMVSWDVVCMHTCTLYVYVCTCRDEQLKIAFLLSSWFHYIFLHFALRLSIFPHSLVVACKSVIVFFYLNHFI